MNAKLDENSNLPLGHAKARHPVSRFLWPIQKSYATPYDQAIGRAFSASFIVCAIVLFCRFILPPNPFEKHLTDAISSHLLYVPAVFAYLLIVSSKRSITTSQYSASRITLIFCFWNFPLGWGTIFCRDFLRSTDGFDLGRVAMVFLQAWIMAQASGQLIRMVLIVLPPKKKINSDTTPHSPNNNKTIAESIGTGEPESSAQPLPEIGNPN